MGSSCGGRGASRSGSLTRVVRPFGAPLVFSTHAALCAPSGGWCGAQWCGAPGRTPASPTALYPPGRALLQLGELALDRLAPGHGRLVALLGQGLALDLELHDAPLDLVDLGRQRVDLDAQP